jgi:hypothetical protein
MQMTLQVTIKRRPELAERSQIYITEEGCPKIMSVFEFGARVQGELN